MAPEPIKIIGGILRSELALKEDQVILVDQKFDIPADQRLYIAIALLGARDFGVKNEFEPDPATGLPVETQVINRQEMYSITLYSRSGEARTRNWEVVAALNSIFAQQEQEKYAFKIGNLPTDMIKVPDPDGTARLEKYTLTFLALVAYKKAKTADYYDRFALPKLITNP